MLVPIAIDLSVAHTNSTALHDPADAAALVNYIDTTPCVLLYNGETFDHSHVFSLLDSLPPKTRNDLTQRLMKMPTYRIANWNGVCGPDMPPYSYFGRSVFAVPRQVFTSIINPPQTNEDVFIQAGTTDITMWHTISLTPNHKHLTMNNYQYVLIDTPRDSLWGGMFEAVVKHTKLRLVTVIDRYVFKRGAIIDLSAAKYFITQIQNQTKNEGKSIRLVFVIESEVYYDDELADITKQLSGYISDCPKIKEIHICSMSHQTMMRHYHDRHVFFETVNNVLYEAKIGTGLSAFHGEFTDRAFNLSLSFYWLADSYVLYRETKFRTEFMRNPLWYEINNVRVSEE
jgi:hypothetical protein